MYRVQARKKGVTGYRNVCRPTKFGNSFSIEEYGRTKAVQLYKEKTIRPKIKNDTIEEWLGDLIDAESIGCTCPLTLLCHADVLVWVINKIRKYRRIKNE